MTDTIKFFIIGAILAALSGFGYYTYSAIKDKGFQEAKLICEQNFKKYEEERDKKIAAVEEASRALVEESRLENDKLAKKMGVLVKQLKAKPLVLVKEGQCTITQTFSDSFGKINQTANQSMKDKQK